jgi:hypothetical protein
MRKNGRWKKCDLEKVLERKKYLKTKGKDLMTKLGWESPTSNPEIISIYVTKMGFWWTKYPPIATDVNFVEIRLLDDFIKNLQ